MTGNPDYSKFPTEPDTGDGEDIVPGFPVPQTQDVSQENQVEQAKTVDTSAQETQSVVETKAIETADKKAAETSIQEAKAHGAPKALPAPSFDVQGRTIIRDQASVSFLMLPTDFVLANRVETEFCRYFEYKIPANATMKIAHWDYNNPNSRFSDEIAQSFRSILAMEPHVLADGEIESLEEVIPPEVYGHTGAFDIINLRTESFSGKTVLLLENKWWDADRKAYGLFFASDPEGYFLESIHFEGTDLDYRRNFLTAKAAFLKIKWRQ